MGLAAFIAHFDGEATSAPGRRGANGGSGLPGVRESRATLGLISRGRALMGLRPGAGLALCQRAASASSGAWAPLIRRGGRPWPLGFCCRVGSCQDSACTQPVGSALTCCTRRLRGPCVPPCMWHGARTRSQGQSRQSLPSWSRAVASFNYDSVWVGHTAWREDNGQASPPFPPPRHISPATSGQAVWLLWFPRAEAPWHEPSGQGLPAPRRWRQLAAPGLEGGAGGEVPAEGAQLPRQGPWEPQFSYL